MVFCSFVEGRDLKHAIEERGCDGICWVTIWVGKVGFVYFLWCDVCAMQVRDRFRWLRHGARLRVQKKMRLRARLRVQNNVTSAGFEPALFRTST